MEYVRNAKAIRTCEMLEYECQALTSTRRTNGNQHQVLATQSRFTWYYSPTKDLVLAEVLFRVLELEPVVARLRVVGSGEM